MLTYEKLKKKPSRFLALTSVTVEEFDKLLGQGLGEFGRVAQHIFAARRRVVQEPGFLEFNPGLRIEIVQTVSERAF